MATLAPAATSKWRRSIETWSLPAAWSIAALFCLASLYIASRRLFWTDEVATTLATRLPDWASVWRCGDLMPLAYLALARVFDQWFGPGEIGIRLPSVIAVSAGLLVTFDCARRLSDRLHGLIALGALLCSFLPYYASEGRSYGLYFLCAALALWTWLFSRRAPLIGIVFFVGTLLHFYMVLCLVPLAVAEALEWRRWRAPSSKLVAAFLGSVAALGVLWPQVSHARNATVHFVWAEPSLTRLAGSYLTLFPLAPLLVALCLAGMALSSGKKATVLPMSPAERVAWLSLLIPIAGFLAAELVTNVFVERYLIGALPGVAVGLAFLVDRIDREQFLFSIGLLLLLLAAGGWRVASATIHPAWITQYGDYQGDVKAILHSEDEYWKDGKRFIVMPESKLFLPARYYSSHSDRYVAIPGNPPLETRYFPLPKWTDEELIQHARETALVAPGPELLQRLNQAGVRLILHKIYPSTYYLER